MKIPPYIKVALHFNVTNVAGHDRVVLIFILLKSRRCVGAVESSMLNSNLMSLSALSLNPALVLIKRVAWPPLYIVAGLVNT